MITRLNLHFSAGPVNAAFQGEYITKAPFILSARPLPTKQNLTHFRQLQNLNF
jgi:hypothetical protein